MNIYTLDTDVTLLGFSIINISFDAKLWKKKQDFEKVFCQYSKKNHTDTDTVTNTRLQ